MECALLAPGERETVALSFPRRSRVSHRLQPVISFSPEQQKRAVIRVPSLAPWNPCILRARVGRGKPRSSGTVFGACCTAEVEAGTCAV